VNRPTSQLAFLHSLRPDSLIQGFLAAVVLSLLVAIAAVLLQSNGKAFRPIELKSTELSVIPLDDKIQSPQDAYSALIENNSAKIYNLKTQLSDSFWIGIPIRNLARDGSKTVELRTMRGRSLEFWLFKEGRRESPMKVIASNEKGGISIKLDILEADSHFLVGRVVPLGVSRPRALLWSTSDFDQSRTQFERAGGGLLGAFVGLALLSFMIGLLNRDWSFFLFSGWLITSLRVASINEGWDLLWIGIDLTPQDLMVVLRATLAAHPLLTTALFTSLLKTELEQLGLTRWLNAAIVIFAAITVASPLLDHATLLSIVWSSSGAGIVLILVCLAIVVHRKRSAVSIWYAGSWCVTFLGALLQVAYASGLLSAIVPGLTTQSTSIASALVTAIALAERLRVERNARLEAQKDKLDALERFKQNYNSMPVGLFSMDLSGQILLCNPAFASMFEAVSDIDGRFSSNIDTMLGDGTADRLRIAAIQSSPDIEISSKDSTSESQRWFLARVTSKGDSIEGSIQEITQRKHAEAKLRHLVDHDSLTGLRNRRGLEQAVSEASGLVDTGVPCAVAHVAMDRFKLINDLYGHATGDAMLQQAANRLLQSVRSRDHIARLADSFVVVFLDCPDFAVMGLSERLRESINDTPFELDGKRLDMTVSVGVVSFDPKMGAVDTMAAAGRACAEAKARGRNCVVRLDDRDTRLRSHLEELKVVADLQRKITTDRYFLDFQPIVALQSPHGSLSYEVLLRMRDENGGVIPPGRFIGAAERNGLMSDIDRWVLRSTLEWMDAHPQHRNRLSFATINISGASLNDARFVDDAFSMIADHPLAMPKLCFEITESVALNDIGSTRRFIDRVRMYGSKLALDDFGAGYTSFNYLKEIPADFIKIDGSFVRDINSDPANYAITRTIVDLTHELGMQSIAEWAETPDTVASLIELKVDYGQGFGLARPMDKRIVTNALSCGELVKDEQVLRLLTATESMSLALHGDTPVRLQ